MSSEREDLVLSFQNEARMFAHRAADRLRDAARQLDDDFPADLIRPQDGMDALTHYNRAMQEAGVCLSHAVHQHTIAVLHKERAS